MDFQRIIEEAHNLATTEMTEYRQKWWDNLSEVGRAAVKQNCGALLEPLYCGRAWVSVKGTTPIARFCAKQEQSPRYGFYGRKGYPKGWYFYCPGYYSGQSLDVFEAGAKAFAEHLRANGIECTVHTRAD